MRVLIVDDSAFMRRAISQMLTSDPEIEIAGTGKTGREAVDLAKKLQPDVITLDVEMPEMDGLTALRHIMRDCPTQVLMLSSLTTEGSHAALRALQLGAADVLAKDVSQVSLSITNIQQDLLVRVRALGMARKKRRAFPRVALPPLAGGNDAPVYRAGQFDMVCIGSSTGGPPVLETLVKNLPPSFSASIVIAQHMPELFTRSMAERLRDICPLTVRHGEDHMPIERKTIYIAPGGRHTHINRLGLIKWELLVNDQPREALYKPSVDALLHSAAKHVGSRTLGIVLTGIGDDGLQGAKALHARGGTILAQSEESCVVYGMPKAVTENAITAASLDPVQIAQVLRTLADPVPSAKVG